MATLLSRASRAPCLVSISHQSLSRSLAGSSRLPHCLVRAGTSAAVSRCCGVRAFASRPDAPKPPELKEERHSDAGARTAPPESGPKPTQSSSAPAPAPAPNSPKPAQHSHRPVQSGHRPAQSGDSPAQAGRSPAQNGHISAQTKPIKTKPVRPQKPVLPSLSTQAPKIGKESDEAKKQSNTETDDQEEDGEKKEDGPKKDKNNPDGNKRSTLRTVLEVSGVAVSWLAVAYGPGLFKSSTNLSWQDVRKNYLEKGLVQRFIVNESSVVAVLHHPENIENPRMQGTFTFTPRVTFSIASRDAFEKNLNQAQDDLDIPSSDRIPVEYAKGAVILPLLYQFGPTLLLVGLILFARSSTGGRGGDGGIFGMMKSRAKIYSETSIKVRFADVAGLDEAKVEIMEFVSFLKDPTKFERLGARIPRGAILSGPPGTGKTMLAKATAGECGVPFFSVSGSEFVEVFVGVGPSRVRDLFAMARKHAPSIIFIDEIDAIGRSRQSEGRYGGNSEREATLNQILTEMDGFNTQQKVVVLAGTNRADVLDKALLRPGRFDRHIYIDRPTMKGRVDIFRVHLQKIKTDENIEELVGKLASMTPGFSGADIANVVNEAALIAARNDANSVTRKHFEDAVDRVIGGLEKKSMVIKPDEKKIVAYHEAGHAICGWFLKDCDPLVKVSIIPRGRAALGYAQYLPVSDSYLMTVSQLMDRMAMTLAGRVSEEMHFDSVTTGGSDDFQKVTTMARRMVTEWGMSAKIGPIHFDDSNQQFSKPFAEATAQTIDAEVQRIVQEGLQRCRDLLRTRKPEIALVAEELLKKEMLTREDMFRLLGKRPWASPEEFEKYFDGSATGPESSPPPFPSDLPEPADQAPPPADPEPAMRESAHL